MEFYNSTHLILSSGVYGKSQLGIFELHDCHAENKYGTITMNKNVQLTRSYFGEGATLYGGFIYFLTWRERTVFVYDKHLKYIKTIPFPSYMGQGWGLAHDS